MIYEAVVVDLPWYVSYLHLKSCRKYSSEIFYKTFTQWQSRMKRFACRTSHGNPPDVRRRPADDPPMIVRCVFHRGIPVRESADFRTEARRTPAERRPISWQYFGTHRLGHRAMSVRTSYDVHPMPRIPYSSSPVPSRCADIGNIGRDIVRPPVDLWPWHYDSHCPWHWAPFPIGFLEIRKVYRQFAEIRSMPQESKWKVTELYEKSSRHYQNLHFQIPWFFPYESQFNDFPTGTFFKEFNYSPFRWTPKFLIPSNPRRSTELS